VTEGRRKEPVEKRVKDRDPHIEFKGEMTKFKRGPALENIGKSRASEE